MTENKEILFLLCDDMPSDLKHNIEMVQRVMDRNYAVPPPHVIKLFDDGQPVLDLLLARADTAGIVLISDGNMIELDGFVLMLELHHAGKLPAQSFICSNIRREGFDSLLKAAKLDKTPGRIGFLDKSHGFSAYRELLPDAIEQAAKEIGLGLPERSPPVPPRRGQKPQP